VPAVLQTYSESHRLFLLALSDHHGLFTAVQLRKVPPKKPEGEIKPYSLMEREGGLLIGSMSYI